MSEERSNQLPSAVNRDIALQKQVGAEANHPSLAPETVEGEFVTGGPGFSGYESDPVHTSAVYEGVSERLHSGIQLMDHINNKLVMDKLEREGARFTTQLKEPNGNIVRNEDGDSVPQYDERPVTYLGAENFSAKLYDINGDVVDMGKHQAIMIDQGVVYLVDKTEGHDFSPAVEGMSAEKKREAPLLAEDAEMELNDNRSPGRGGFNIFPSMTPKPASGRSKKRAEALAAAGYLGETLENDLMAAHELLDKIKDAGGPMSPEAFDSLRKFHDVMDGLASSFDEASLSGISSKNLPQFESLKELMDGLNDKVSAMGDFLTGGQSILNGEMMTTMKEAMKQFVNQLSSTFTRGAS